METIRNVVAFTSLAWLMLAVPNAVAADLPDGTIVHLRLVSPITSELTKAGDTIRFVVDRDVIIDGAVVIARKTPAVGTVVAARRASRGDFVVHHAKLQLTFIQTRTVDGQPIRLRACNDYGQVNIDRGDYHHDLQWATEGDVFEASVARDAGLR
jgi:hypothetical protein